MSQNDMSIANAAGSVVRADINSALQALASNNAGSSAPSTTYGNQWWFDTANDILKHRDEANTAWANVASLVSSTWIPYRSGTLIGAMATLDDTAIARDLVMSSKRVKFASASIVAATTTDLSTLGGNKGVVTGNTTITGFGTTQAGETFFLTFTGTPQITHNATSNIVVGGASLTMAAGNFAIVMSEGSGNNRIFVFKADGSAVVGATAVASQADQEAATSLTAYVTPGRQHYHPSACKAWVRFTVAAAISASYNVSSITDNGVGDWTINFTTAFSNALYAFLSGILAGAAIARGVVFGSQATGSIGIWSINTGAGGANESSVTALSAGFCGDQ